MNIRRLKRITGFTLVAALAISVFGTFHNGESPIDQVFADENTQDNATPTDAVPQTTTETTTQVTTQATTEAVDYAALSALTNEYNETVKEKQEVQKKLNSLLEDQNSFISKLREIDNMIIDYQNKMDDISSRTTQAYKMMEGLSQKIDQAENNRQAALEEAKEYIAQEYENSPQSFTESFLNSQDYAEVVNNSEYIQAIDAYNNKVIDDILSSERSLSDQKLLLESLTEDLSTLDEAYKNEQDILQNLSDEKEKQISFFESSIDSTKEELSEIEQTEREKSSQLASMTKNSNSSITTSNSINTLNTSSLKYNGEAFTWPVPDSTNITSYYGKREQPMEGASSDHKGIDISCSNGATIVAVVDGIVSQADYSDGYGNKIMIDHGSHISTLYAHLSRFAVSPGDKVTKGQIIGYAGMTGTATDYHLHFAVREEGEYVNPLKYYPGFASDSTVGFSSNKH